MCLEVPKRGCLEDDQVTVSVGSERSAAIAVHFEWRYAANKPLVDSRPRDNFDQCNAVIAPAAPHTEIHRGGQQNLLVQLGSGNEAGTAHNKAGPLTSQ